MGPTDRAMFVNEGNGTATGLELKTLLLIFTGLFWQINWPNYQTEQKGEGENENDPRVKTQHPALTDTMSLFHLSEHGFSSCSKGRETFGLGEGKGFSGNLLVHFSGKG